MRIRVLPSRGLDVAEAHFAGRQLAWLSTVGFVPWNGDWTASWGGGLVTTCGLDNVGRPSEGIGLHGTYTSLPAVDGVVHDPRGLRVERTYDAAEGALRLVDLTTNGADVELEAPLLYHVNLWAEGARVETDADEVVPRDADAAPHDWRSPDSGPDVPERVWEHVGATRARIAYDGVELEIRSSLPRLWQWNDPAKGALGIEPANCSVLGRAHDRAAGRLPFLAPGATRETWLSITAKETTR